MSRVGHTKRKRVTMHALIAGLPGGAEWIILLLVAVLLFGGSRLAGIGKGTGRAIREFKEETQDLRGKNKQLPASPATTTSDADDIRKVEQDLKNQSGNA